MSRSWRVLNGSGDPQWLPRHTENLTDTAPARYFALGCIRPAKTGGATYLYDGQAAARALLQDHPGLTQVRITYATQYRPATATHPLVTINDDTPILRYRSQLPTNTIVGPLPEGMTHTDLYRTVEKAITDATALAYTWSAGDLVIVDNNRMVHARAPYDGDRVMMRYRYDDPHFHTVIINQ